MIDFVKRNLIFLVATLGTLILIIGGVFLFSKNGASAINVKKIADNILVPGGSYKTSGIVNGKFQPASSTATVTLVEFGDYECPACGSYNPLVDKLLTEFNGKINLVFRNFPLPQHKNANISAAAAEAAGLQGKFWEMYDKLYETQGTWSKSTDAKSIFDSIASDLGLNIDQFNKDLDAKNIKEKILKDLADGNLIGVNSTPSFYLQGVKIDNPRGYDEFKKLIEDAIAKNPISQLPREQAYHAHFDLKVYVNGKAVDFTLAKYQSTHEKELNPGIHFHDGNGKVVHLHKEGMKLNDLFTTFGLGLASNTTGYVNGKKVENISQYVPQDLDQILIGGSNMNTVSNDACIYSLKCPERGKPPTEECVGGLGTGCAK